MIKYGCTANQGLLLDKTELYRNFTISASIKLSEHLDNTILLEAVNEEIIRNDSLRMLTKKHFFKWENTFMEPFKINEVKVINGDGKTKEEVRKIIDNLCDKPIILKTADKPFEIFKVSSDEGDYIVLRVLHLNMDVYAVLLTLADIAKVYYAKLNNTQIEGNLTSVREYLEKYNADKEKIDKKIKEDTNYFIEKNKAMGEPTYLGCEGGFDGSEKRFKINIFKPHPLAYVESVIDKELADKINNYCKENKTTIASLFLSSLELIYSALNNNYKDVSMFYTSDYRAKLSEKMLPLTNSTSIFFRRIINNELTVEEFVKECDVEYIQTLRHVTANISKIYSYLINLKLLDLNGCYHQIVFSFIPVKFDGLPDGIEVEPYVPREKEGSDFTVYYIVVPNPDGTYNLVYKYYTDILKEENILNLDRLVHKALETIVDNKEMKVEEILEELK